MLRYMLDTNICIHIIKKRPISLLDKFNKCGMKMCVSVVTLGELFYGAEKSMRRQENLNNVGSLVSRLKIMNWDQLAADHFAQIRTDLEKKGTPIGPYDLMISAHARSKSLICVTNNLREFERVDGLRTENWLQATH